VVETGGPDGGEREGGGWGGTGGDRGHNGAEATGIAAMPVRSQYEGFYGGNGEMLRVERREEGK
jgi:hypothetical protein